MALVLSVQIHVARTPLSSLKTKVDCDLPCFRPSLRVIKGAFFHGSNCVTDPLGVSITSVAVQPPPSSAIVVGNTQRNLLTRRPSIMALYL